MRSTGLLLLGFIFFLSCQSSREGKSGNIPSGKGRVQEIITVKNITDTAEVNSIIRKGNAYVNTKIDSAIFLFQLAVKAAGVDYPEGRAIVFGNMAYCYLKKNESELANRSLAAVEKELEEVPSLHFVKGKNAHRKLLGQKYGYRGSKYFKLANYDSSSLFFLKMVEVLGQPDSVTYSTLGWAYMGLGAISARLSDHSRAMNYFNKIENLAAKFSDSVLLVNALSDKSALLGDDKKYAEGLAVAQRGLGIAVRINEQEPQITLANSIAICLIEQQKPKEALPYSKMVLEIAKRTQLKEHIVSGHYILGYNYVQLKQYRKAERILLRGLKQALEINEIDNIANVYGQLSVVYQALDQYPKALDYRIKYAAVRDSLLGKESTNRIAEVETRYRVAQKDKELAQKDKVLLQNELKIASQQKVQYLWIGGGSLCILFLLGLLYRKRYRTELTKLKATIEGEEKERSRLARELHDGIVSRLSIIKMNFSALPQLYPSLSEAGDFQDVVEQLEQSITELRTTSHNLLPEILLRTGLTEAIRIYCEKIRKIALLDIEFQVIGELPPLTDDFQLNVYRIIQELINNMIKHSNASHALIQLNLQEEWLNITLDDNGTGSPDILQEQESGIGLRSLQNRVKLLNGSLEIESGKGTSIYLEFNLKKFIQKE